MDYAEGQIGGRIIRRRGNRLSGLCDSILQIAQFGVAGGQQNLRLHICGVVLEDQLSALLGVLELPALKHESTEIKLCPRVPGI